MSKEQSLVKQLMQYLALKGIFAWRQNQGAVKSVYGGKVRFFRFASVKGISDIIGVLPDGRMLAIEAKVGRNKPSDDQEAFLSSINDSGGLGFVAYSLDDVMKGLDDAGWLAVPEWVPVLP